MKRYILLLWLIITHISQIKAQNHFEMKCIGLSVYNTTDTVKVSNKYLGKIIKVSNDVKSHYSTNSHKGQYIIGNKDYSERHSQTTFVSHGIDYWTVYDIATFSEDYNCLKVTICRPLFRDTEKKRIILYYTTDLSAENNSKIGFPQYYNVKCPRCNGTGKIKANRDSQHPDECTGICGLCNGNKKLTKQFKVK